ncbi:MAG: tRNA (adenosine(37)-N6)-threonylcarbamoyltransferase complex dimerization subunit type 1 TsaB [Waddliaceae bacterium]|nr:tRNA (adenosine(37)-N6)-threonylcarbamoyltransferase complex dimerization subunit type 1 TsaB [Waddliaceae bacterium]MBT3578510.1 tRNA (adenosine(37)-N6)-threonylcarbamoyltransferase complex dimerization subunit type 1 TsaB [Waddliaceae bacterium]MBT6928738.1 tRNA (adenosine(37)-N6)-threonylcarbamoyltransferase complex dimerization subunit type 1 TsaB [Waddliaceae bacterium]MBT7461701.1 tRNA (adenosine(37)-N6)-threonylcarbamoyltransferase complex dimerization subunit type 1 TsaB [Waddliaceae 
MKNLIIDTTTEQSIVAVADDNKIISSTFLPQGYNHSKNILVSIKKSLDKAKLQRNDITAITVAIGPGSYTGIRVGVTVAKNLAFAWNIPIITVCSLEGFIPENNGAFAAVIDAKISGIYAIIGEKDGNNIKYTTTPSVLPWSQAAEALHDVETIITPNKTAIETKIQETLNKDIAVTEMPPSPQRLATIAAQKYHDNDIITDNNVNILYLRKTQAEIEQQ